MTYISSMPSDFNRDQVSNLPLQDVGKLMRTGWYWSKLFLSADNHGKLNVKRLNPLQMLARKLFGLYQETHLKRVILSWNDYQLKHGCVCPELNEKLSKLWAKKHSDSILLIPPPTFVIGNSNLHDAEVIGIGQLFSDQNNSKFCGDILTENYREGDVILVEGVDADKEVSASENMQTLFLSAPAQVYGWEPVGYEALRDKLFESAISIENEFHFNYSILFKLLNNINFAVDSEEFQILYPKNQTQKLAEGSFTIVELPKQLTPQEKEKTWEKLLDTSLENFLNSVKKIEERYGHQTSSPSYEDAEFASPAANALQELEKQFKLFLQTTRTKNDSKLICKTLAKIYKQTNKCLQKKKYSAHWTKEQDSFFKNTWAVRQESLCNEINRYRELNKRVFVCAGTAHFFPNKGKGDSEVMSTLLQHKFALAMHNIKQNATYYSFEDLAKKFNSSVG